MGVPAGMGIVEGLEGLRKNHETDQLMGTSA